MLGIVTQDCGDQDSVQDSPVFLCFSAHTDQAKLSEAHSWRGEWAPYERPWMQVLRDHGQRNMDARMANAGGN
ncbi:conserved hypothetical protein [Aspergillus fumigatus A1163]|uniref:Uncharacterized protein n=1 Tax=Aspergillus fumigatus (strain CBS 144.89 / FGSC A1163 / CEA10) TaxID=451804 RepID=B0XRU9_ASPFC|nr:conserved hypothetical protein [Aspergillus fumigatus A1163]